MDYSSLEIKQVGGPCACDCHGIEAIDSNYPMAATATKGASSAKTPGQSDKFDACARPSMVALHRLLQNGEWKAVQDAIRKDASVAMRIDDSPEEDHWFDEARRRKAAQEGVRMPPIDHGDAASPGEQRGNGRGSRELGDSPSDQGGDLLTMLRYWVGNNGAYDYNSANVHIRQKRTLLHSICRMNFPSNEALMVQLAHGDSDGLKSLMGAVKTVEMLINASHDNLIGLNGDADRGGRSDGGMKEVATDRPRRNDCPCRFYRRCCPPVLLPPVERHETHDSTTEHSEENIEMVQHTSVLTMTDAMGETPLHALTGAGSCHPDLVEVLIKACRTSDESSGDHGSERRPTVYNLLVAQNCHGCTPVHFLADSKNEDVLCMLLDHCKQLPNDTVHPTMIKDNEGDLPLHFAACNGASQSLLHALTTSLGDGRSALVCNSQGRLAIDDFIEWYVISLNERRDREVSDGEDGSESDSEDDSDDSLSSSSVSTNSSQIGQGLGLSLKNIGIDGETNPEYYASCNFGFLPSVPNWASELWPQMWVLIQAAASAIRNPVHGNSQTIEEMQTQCGDTLPIHAAVIATKHANFPALALAASMLRNGNVNDDGEDINGEDVDCLGRMRMPLLEEDARGHLPLHWACAHIPSANDEVNRGPLNPSTAQCKAILRWNTKDLPCSMIEYLLHCEPTAACKPTRQGRLPLHMLVEDCSSDKLHVSECDEPIWHPWNDIKALLREYPEALETPDATSRLYPFQVAAASYIPSHACTESLAGLNSLESTYRLLLEDSSLLCQSVQKK